MGTGNNYLYLLLSSFCAVWIGLPEMNAQLKRFSPLSTDETGITFENTLTDEKTHNILLYSNYYGGAGVGVGDFNKDGLPDLFFAGNLVHDALYYNKGGMQFEDGTGPSGILKDDGWSSGVVVGDVNNDGWLDIYVTRELYDESPARRKNKLYINTGEKVDLGGGLFGVRFEEKSFVSGLDSPERTRHAAFIDYDRDGWLDVFLLNQPPNPGNYSAYMGQDLMQERWAPRLMRNRGDGTFLDVSRDAGVLKPGYPNSVSIGDFDQDGWPDIYVSNDYDAPDFLYRNNGDGTFTDVMKEEMNHISFYTMGVDAGDINNDGWLDVMTLDMVAEDNFRLKANMSGMNPDAFWKVVDQGGHYQYMYNALHLNQGGVRWSDIAQLSRMPSTDWSWSNLIADFDQDGWQDVHITNGLLRDIRNTDASKTFPKYVRKSIDDFIRANPNAGDVSVFDILDLEKALNLLPSVPLQNYMFRNQGDLTFEKVMDEWGLSGETFSNGSAYSDLDGDGDLDLIVNHLNAPAQVYRNNSESFENANWLLVRVLDQDNHEPVFGAVVNIKMADGSRQVRELTSVRGMYSTSENVAHFGLGNHAWVDQMTVTLPGKGSAVFAHVEANQVVIVDVRDLKQQKDPGRIQKPLFVEVGDPPPIAFLHQENDFDDYAKQVLLPHKMSQFGPAIAVGDVNGDGLDDLFAGGAAGQQSRIFVQQAAGDFSEILIKDDPLFEDIDAAFMDVDLDGDMDLYVVSGGNAFPPQSSYYQDRLYLNTDGQFARDEALLPKFRESGGAVRPRDFDGDGDMDLLVCGRHQPWSYPEPTVSRLLVNENGKFRDMTKKLAPDLVFAGMVSDAVWMDFDGDGDEDFILTGEWMPITVFEHSGGAFTRRNDLIPNSTGWWYAIEKGDLDGDGDLDLVVGNLGLNYKYQASPEAPFEVHYDDFDRNGSKDIVLSYYNFGEQYPLRGRSCSSDQVPSLKEKFPTYAEFASANIEEVYGEKKLEKALHYQAQTFASAILENRGGGAFEMIPLPNEAQVSSINDIHIEDLDYDGFPDILAAGNLFTSEVETPRNDASVGILLKGNGTMRFSPLPVEESGIQVPYDVKQIRKLSAGGETWFVFGCNDDWMRFIRYGARQDASN